MNSSKIKVSAIFSLIFALNFGLGKVFCDDVINSTTSELVSDPQPTDDSSTTIESLRIENQVSEMMATTETTTTTHKIPPTLLNTMIDYRQEKSGKPEEKSEMHEKFMKEFGKSEMAMFHPKTGQIIDARVKQAIINSKQQAFKNHNVLNTKAVESKKPTQDQVAKSAEVNNDISKESPKSFLPSPEVSPLFNRENQLQDHFSPMNQYYRSTQQDARYPHESPFSSAKPALDTRWLGGNRSPNEIPKPTQPFDYMRPPQYLPTQGRNSYNPEFSYRNPIAKEYYDDRVTFPSDGPPVINDLKPNWPVDHKVPDLNFKHQKGTWKWIPEDENFTKNTTNDYYPPEHESKNIQQNPPLLYENYPPFTPPRDHPYTFDQPKGILSQLFGHHMHAMHSPLVSEHHYSRYPTGPSGYPSSGSDTYQIVSEEYSTQKIADHAAPTKLPTEIKQNRPSPWKKIIHVMTAAIPIGLIISALTPRIVYVHPNATVPTLQQPLLPQSQQYPNQQFSNQQPLNGQVNGPYPLRQRSTELNDESINNSLIHFLKTMEMQFQDKQLQSGEKLDGNCEDRFFCEVALIGKQPTADALHQTLYHVALETPDSEAKKSGLGEIFSAIKRQSCDVFVCEKLF